MCIHALSSLLINSPALQAWIGCLISSIGLFMACIGMMFFSNPFLRPRIPQPLPSDRDESSNSDSYRSDTASGKRYRRLWTCISTTFLLGLSPASVAFLSIASQRLTTSCPFSFRIASKSFRSDSGIAGASETLDVDNYPSSDMILRRQYHSRRRSGT